MKLFSCLSFAKRDKYLDEHHIFLCQVPTVFLPMLLSVLVLILLVKMLGQQIYGSVTCSTLETTCQEHHCLLLCYS